MDSIDYYDRYAVPYYEETVEFGMEEQIKRFVELLPESADVLDLGCGSGRDTVCLEEEGCVVTAMDGSEKMCELASIHTGKEVLHLRAEDMDLGLCYFRAFFTGQSEGHYGENPAGIEG